MAVTEMAVSPLPGQPQAVWTVKASVTDEFDHYIIVSFTNATLVGMGKVGSRDGQYPRHARNLVQRAYHYYCIIHCAVLGCR